MVPHSPVQGSCEFSLTPSPPSEVQQLTIKSYDFSNESFDDQMVLNQLNIEWNTPSTPVASVSSLGYELWIGENISQHDAGDVHNLTDIQPLNEVRWADICRVHVYCLCYCVHCMCMWSSKL